jgi:hypothetical protein
MTESKLLRLVIIRTFANLSLILNVPGLLKVANGTRMELLLNFILNYEVKMQNNISET